MADDTRDTKPESVDAALGEMKLEETVHPVSGESTIAVNGKYEDTPSPTDMKNSRSATPVARKSSSQSPLKGQSASQTPKSEYDEDEDEDGETIGGDITLTVEPGKAPKLSRKSIKKIPARQAPLFTELPDSTAESLSVFQVIPECLYGSKSMGRSKMSDEDDEPIECDCTELRISGKNVACGEDSDCINRATKMECIDGDCPCGRGCQNQRFQRKQYANVSVIKTDKKGFGLRANTDLKANDFVFEYIGEVINEPTFRKRTIQYDQEGIRHFYFMSLNKSEFIDATKKGNLGRFCNHSCSPNCYVDKWVVGQKLRMGIFAERNIKAGEELVFNYNVDRYGADPQPCYCGEPNCSGYIGGKTQSGRATQLSHGTIEALGIDDGDGWDSAVAKKPRKKKAGEDDEEYVNNVQPKGLDENGARKVMAALMQCKEKWLAVKFLDRLLRCDEPRVLARVLQLHGYQILRGTISTWKDDDNVILQVLGILYKFPRMTRNKINESKIESAIQPLVHREHEDVAFEAKRLLEEWSKLEVGYRIPKKVYDPNAPPPERRNTDRVEEVTKSPTPAAAVAPTGPRINVPHRSIGFIAPRPPIRRPLNSLPKGWLAAHDGKGNTYYYTLTGQTTWHRPTLPAPEPPPPPRAPPESVQKTKKLQEIIDEITNSKPAQSSQTPAPSASTSQSTPKEKNKPVEKWRSMSHEKQMKLYENTLFPHIKYVMDKYTKKLSKADCKKFAKEVAKKLVASDFKNKRVDDPTKITDKQEKKVKQYVKEYFEKAVKKKEDIDRHRKEKEARKAKLNGSAHGPKPNVNGNAKTMEMDTKGESDVEPDEDPEMDMTPSSPTPCTPSVVESSFEPSDLKRKRERGEETPGDDSESSKRRKEEDLSPPPPPPPPPAESMPEGEEQDEMEDVEGMEEMVIHETKEERDMREQEEELMRENEEAMMMDMDGSLKSAEEHLYQNGHTQSNGNGNGYGIKSGPEPHLQPTGATIDPPSRKVRMD